MVEDDLKELSNNYKGGNYNINVKDDTAIAWSLTDGARGATQEQNGNKGIKSSTDKPSKE